jgi:mannose-6-phosphate isomerase-like protein (cupin superfamily)
VIKPKIVKKPWGEEIWFAHTEKYAGKILVVKKGHRLSLQYHNKKDETFYIDKGILKITAGPKKGPLTTRILREGKSFHVPSKTIHRTEALTNSRIIEVSSPELWDIVRLDDDYQRVSSNKIRAAKES